jgi:hypothetical protein
MVCHFLNPIRRGLANGASLAQLRYWHQHMQALPVYHQQALPPIVNRGAALRRATLALTGHLAAFAKRMTAGLVS